MTLPDWVHWQVLYDAPQRVVAQRLLIVQRFIRQSLEKLAGHEVKVVSVCAGQGHDILGVLADCPGRDLVSGRLVELDPANTLEATRRAHAAGLGHIEVITGDASVTDAYAGAVPADLVLVCGVFGNITHADVQRTIDTLPQFCTHGATVIWTRHRGPPDLTPTIRGWFEAAGFVELGFASTAAEAQRPGPFPAQSGAFPLKVGAFPAQSVGAHRWPGNPTPLVLGTRLFTFFR